MDSSPFSFKAAPTRRGHIAARSRLRVGVGWRCFAVEAAPWAVKLSRASAVVAAGEGRRDVDLGVGLGGDRIPLTLLRGGGAHGHGTGRDRTAPETVPRCHEGAKLIRGLHSRLTVGRYPFVEPDGHVGAPAQPQNGESPAGAGLSSQADEGTRTLDLLHGKRAWRGRTSMIAALSMGFAGAQ